MATSTRNDDAGVGVERKEWEIQWHEWSQEDVMDYFMKGYKKKIHQYETFYDPVKKKFILKLYVDKE